MLVCVALAVFCGSVLHYAFKRYPRLADMINYVDSDKAYSKLDLNRAGFEELVALPFIGEYTAQNIIEYRREHGPFQSVEEVKQVKGIKIKNYERFAPYLRVRR